MAGYFLLGPQRPVVNLATPFGAVDDGRSVAVVSAGWQDAEADIDDVHEIVKRPLVDLRLYQRAEAVLGSEARLREVYRERQDRLQEQQRLYRLRLRQSMLAARRLLRADGDPAILEPEQRHAISQQRALDRHHLQRISAIHGDADSAIADIRPPTLTEHIAEIADVLSGCVTVIITGGNVAVLLNRLRLFSLGPLLAQKNIIAWSAGAMVLADKVVLFHDNTPQGNRDAEVFDVGLGIVNDFVFLPDVKHRLDLSDKVRTALFCRRFAPATCLTLDSGSLLHYEGGHVAAAHGVRRLSRTGTLRRMRAR
ncbi:MAG: Type 1 glutamine amidotransferase-like domain-containing protein [Gammaproteobacteria bacterium]|nr:Type 1 glutamine amidotransferase-like domain-containing protein [Gammaproteobacteria bacterium]